MAPVLIGMAAPDLDEDLAAPAAADDCAAPAPPAMTDVGVATPEVKGTSLAEEAPEKAADCEVALATGVAEVMLGFKTLRMRDSSPSARGIFGSEEHTCR